MTMSYVHVRIARASAGYAASALRRTRFGDIIAKVRHSVGLVVGALAFAGCAAVAGVSDYAVDPCFDGCVDGAAADAPAELDTSVPPPIDGARPDVVDAAVDAPVDAPPLPSPGQSFVALSGTGVAVGKAAIVTLTTKNDAGDLDTRVGAKVTFTTSGGTSAVSFGAVTDNADGTYSASITGVAEGTKILVSAVLDGAPLTTPGASFRVANPIATNLTLSLDATNADTAGHYGGNNCPGSAFITWKALGTNALTGILRGFDAIPCSATSGWNGTGAPTDPFRLTFDGIDDHVGFGANNSLTQQTILAWVRQTGAGKIGTTGVGGFEPATVPPFPRIVPIIAKGTAQVEADDKDINFYLGITTTNRLGSDYESSTWAANPSGKRAVDGRDRPHERHLVHGGDDARHRGGHAQAVRERRAGRDRPDDQRPVDWIEFAHDRGRREAHHRRRDLPRGDQRLRALPGRHRGRPHVRPGADPGRDREELPFVLVALRDADMPELTRRLAIALLAAGMLLSVPARAAEPSAADAETALQLYKEGKALREEGDAQGALLKLRGAYALVETPITALELGRTYVAVGQFVEARAILASVARIPVRPNESAKAGEARTEAESLAVQLRPRLASLTVLPKDAGSAAITITVDAVVLPPEAASAPRVLNPGAHVVVLEANGQRVQSDVTLAEGESKDLEIAVPAPLPPPPPARPAQPFTPPPAEESRTRSPLVYVGFGTAAVGVTVGTITGILTLSKASSLKDTCREGRCPPASQSDLDAASTTGTISTVAFVVAGAGAAAGVVGLFLSKPKTDTPRATASGLHVTPTLNGVSGSF